MVEYVGMLAVDCDQCSRLLVVQKGSRGGERVCVVRSRISREDELAAKHFNSDVGIVSVMSVKR